MCRQKWSNGEIYSQSNDDCSGYGHNILILRYVFDMYGYELKSSHEPSSKCEPSFICDADPSLPQNVKGRGDCRREGYILAGNWLCDPVNGGFVDVEKTSESYDVFAYAKNFAKFCNWVLGLAE